MSNHINKHQVKADWQISKIRTEVLKSVATIYATLNTMLSSDAKIADEAAKTILINKEYYDSLEINSPEALATAVAEYTTNILGLKVSAIDTDTKSTIIFEGGAFINKLVNIQNLSHETSQKLVNAYKNGLADLGGYYGYVTEVASVQPDFIVSFSK